MVVASPPCAAGAASLAPSSGGFCTAAGGGAVGRAHAPCGPKARGPAQPRCVAIALSNRLTKATKSWSQAWQYSRSCNRSNRRVPRSTSLT